MRIHRLYSYWRSSASWRVRIGLYLKEIDGWDYVPVHLVEEGGQQHKDEHRARNPMRQLPVLEVEDDQGQHQFLAQSLAILEFLEHNFPDPAILPEDPIARAQARQMAEIVNAGIQPLQNLSVIQKLRDEMNLEFVPWCQHWIARGFEGLEATAARTAGEFLVGDNPSIADICLVPQMYNARRFNVDLDPFPTLLRVDAHCAELPAFQKAHADNQPDAPSDD